MPKAQSPGGFDRETLAEALEYTMNDPHGSDGVTVGFPIELCHALLNYLRGQPSPAETIEAIRVVQTAYDAKSGPGIEGAVCSDCIGAINGLVLKLNTAQ